MCSGLIRSFWTPGICQTPSALVVLAFGYETGYATVAVASQQLDSPEGARKTRFLPK
jgi:hypothetical protein